MCWVIPPASPATTLVSRMRSSRRVLPWSTWPMTVTTGGRGRSRSLVLLLVVEVLGLQLGFLFLAGVDQADGGVQLGGEQLDHVVGERLGGRDHLALLEEEAHHVGARAVELRTQLLGGRTPLDDDLPVGNRRVGRRVVGDLLGFELFDVAPPAPGRPAAARPPAVAEGRAAAGSSGPAGTGACACSGARAPVAAARRTASTAAPVTT